MSAFTIIYATLVQFELFKEPGLVTRRVAGGVGVETPTVERRVQNKMHLKKKKPEMKYNMVVAVFEVLCVCIATGVISPRPAPSRCGMVVCIPEETVEVAPWLPG